MRSRVAAILAGAAALTAASGAHAAPPKAQKIDGVKVKTIEWQTPVTAQQHLAWTVTGVDENTCTSECDVKPFVYKPAPGVKGNLSVHIKWTADTTTDIDLYVVDQDGKTIATCGGGHGTGEIVSIPTDKLVSGQTYRVVSAYYNVTNPDTLKGKIELPSAYTPTAVPDLFGLEANIGCSQDGSAA